MFAFKKLRSFLSSERAQKSQFGDPSAEPIYLLFPGGLAERFGLDREDELNTTIQLALAEYGLTKDARATSHDGSSKRFNNYLVMVTAIAAVLALAYESGASGLTILMTVLATVTAFIVGIATFRRLVQFTITSTLYTLALNNIRAFFVDIAPVLKPYFVLPTSGQRISFYGVGEESHPSILLINLAGTVALINSLILGTAAGVYLELLFDGRVVALLVGIGLLCVSIYLHFAYQRRKLDAAARRYEMSHSKGPSDMST